MGKQQKLNGSEADRLRVLIIDDDANHAQTIAEVLERVGHHCQIAVNGNAGIKRIEREEYDVILTDLRMADVDGLTIVRKARATQPDAEVFVITGFGEVKTAVQAIQDGAAQYLLKPLDMTELRAILEKTAQRIQLARANLELRQQLDEKFGFEGVIGNSPRMQEVIKRLKAYAPTQATVLILGCNGTGKELAAKALHTNSPRKSKPFVAMNCAALNENLLDDEMFGHEPGAFTGADKLRKGRFEYAHGGTLFLDEVGDMPLSLQAKLLRVLENGEVVRIGSNEPIRVDVRIVSATNRNLEQLIAEGKFRQDLYYRLRVCTLRMPALRERLEDIPLLVNHFLKEFTARHQRNVKGVAEPVWKLFGNFDWPGNVRQLRNTIESMVIQDTDGILGLDDLPEGEDFGQAKPTHRPSVNGPASLIGKPLAEVERYYIEQALALTGGNREEASKMLGIGERTLYRAIQDWKLQDRIREVLQQCNGDMDQAAQQLGLPRETLERKLKKFGLVGADDSD